MTHDYKRNGTTDLFAAMNVGTGEVLLRPARSHKATDVLAFFKLIDLHVDARPRHPRRAGQPLGPQGAAGRDSGWRIRNGPAGICTSRRRRSSWLNLVEGWFKLLTERRLRRGTFTSVDRPHRRHRDLGRALERRPQALRLEQATPRRSSPRSDEAEPPSPTRPNPRRTTSCTRPSGRCEAAHADLTLRKRPGGDDPTDLRLQLSRNHVFLSTGVQSRVPATRSPPTNSSTAASMPCCGALDFVVARRLRGRPGSDRARLL